MCLVKRRHISHLCLDFRDPNLLAINQNTCSEGSLCQWLTFIPVISGPFVLPLESSVSFKINFFYCLCQAWVCKCGVRIKSPETHIERPKRHGFWHWSQVGFFLFFFFFCSRLMQVNGKTKMVCGPAGEIYHYLPFYLTCRRKCLRTEKIICDATRQGGLVWRTAKEERWWKKGTAGETNK